MFSFLKKVSLKQKLIFFTLLLFLLISLAQLGVTFYYFNNIIVGNTHDYFTAIISQIGARIDTEIKACNQFASQITGNSTIAYNIDDIINNSKSKEVVTPQVMAEVLKLQPWKFSSLRDIYIFPVSGYPINCYYSEVISETDPYSALILSGLKHKISSQPIWDDMYAEKNYISSYTPFIENGIAIGLVRIRYEKRIFGNIIDSVNLSSNNTILVVDGLGNIIYSNNSSLIGQPRSKANIESSFVIESPPGNENWVVVGVVPNALAFSQITKLDIIFLILDGIILVFVLFAIIVYSNRLLHPLNKIVYGMKQIQNGNLDVTLKSDLSSEFGFIAENFNNMVYRINSLLSQVYKYQIASKQADIAALEAKLNPHFLYNTLDTIYWLLLMKDNVVEADMVIKLADILRYSISHQDDFVSLWEDIVQIENYIVIQQRRYSDKFTYKITIADDIKDIKIPKLFLQPLVENAFKHGFSNFSRNGFLEIEGFSKDDYIYLIVKDNGTGIPSKILPSVLSSGFGLRVTNDRIAYAYGESCGIEIHSEPEKGTEIILKITRQPMINFICLSD